MGQPAWLLAVGLLAVSGCQSAVRNVKIPLVEGAAVREVGAVGASRIVIEDLRPGAERRPHRGKDIMSCEHWFGDDTFLPSRVAYLLARVAKRTRADMQIHIRLTRFDVVEYCEFAHGNDAAGAARPSSGSPGFTAAPTNGNTVILRLAGDVDGVPFDQSSRFDYGTLYRFPDPPSSSPEYRAQLRGRLDTLIDDIVNKVWEAELARKGMARN